MKPKYRKKSESQRPHFNCTSDRLVLGLNVEVDLMSNADFDIELAFDIQSTERRGLNVELD